MRKGVERRLLDAGRVLHNLLPLHARVVGAGGAAVDDAKPIFARVQHLVGLDDRLVVGGARDAVGPDSVPSTVGVVLWLLRMASSQLPMFSRMSSIS